MYLMIEQLTLVQNTSKRRSDDSVIYRRRKDQWTDIFTLDASPSRYVGPAIRYGTLYWDAQDQPCVIPDVWDEDEVLLARTWIPV